MTDMDVEDQKDYSGLLTHFVKAGNVLESNVDLEKEYKQVEKSMENASKDYEMMMEIHKELKENFQKLVQNKT